MLNPEKYMQHMHDIIPKLFDCWANPLAHLLLLKSSKVRVILMILFHLSLSLSLFLFLSFPATCKLSFKVHSIGQKWFAPSKCCSSKFLCHFFGSHTRHCSIGERKKERERLPHNCSSFYHSSLNRFRWKIFTTY